MAKKKPSVMEHLKPGLPTMKGVGVPKLPVAKKKKKKSA